VNVKVIRTASSTRDLNKIRNWWLATDSEVAFRFAIGVKATCLRLERLPNLGDEYELPDGTWRRRVRIEGFAKYWLYYHFDGAVVRILRVIHSSQNVESEIQR
jgi:plasmid stabilization system protein ParE